MKREPLGNRRSPALTVSMSTRRVTLPERLNVDHEVAAFDNGRHASLNDWLVERALASEGASARPYVVCDDEGPRQVAGHYTITTAMEGRSEEHTSELQSLMRTPSAVFS